MRLYHGSNVTVEKPMIRRNIRALDFGAGFYLTSSKEQATKWAKSVTKRRKTGEPILNIYKIDESKMEHLKVLKFGSANSEWLDFVVTNRKRMPLAEQYDIVIGPVANDSTLDAINDYMRGRFTKEIAVQLLLPQNLTDQYAFLTDDAIALLSFERGDIV